MRRKNTVGNKTILCDFASEIDQSCVPFPPTMRPFLKLDSSVKQQFDSSLNIQNRFPSFSKFQLSPSFESCSNTNILSTNNETKKPISNSHLNRMLAETRLPCHSSLVSSALRFGNHESLSKNELENDQFKLLSSSQSISKYFPAKAFSHFIGNYPETPLFTSSLQEFKTYYKDKDAFYKVEQISHYQIQISLCTGRSAKVIGSFSRSVSFKIIDFTLMNFPTDNQSIDQIYDQTPRIVVLGNHSIGCLSSNPLEDIYHMLEFPCKMFPFNHYGILLESLKSSTNNHKHAIWTSSVIPPIQFDFSSQESFYLTSTAQHFFPICVTRSVDLSGNNLFHFYDPMVFFNSPFDIFISTPQSPKKFQNFLTVNTKHYDSPIIFFSTGHSLGLNIHFQCSLEIHYVVQTRMQHFPFLHSQDSNENVKESPHKHPTRPCQNADFIQLTNQRLFSGFAYPLYCPIRRPDSFLPNCTLSAPCFNKTQILYPIYSWVLLKKNTGIDSGYRQLYISKFPVGPEIRSHHTPYFIYNSYSTDCNTQFIKNNIDSLRLLYSLILSSPFDDSLIAQILAHTQIEKVVEIIKQQPLLKDITQLCFSSLACWDSIPGVSLVLDLLYNTSDSDSDLFPSPLEILTSSKLLTQFCSKIYSYVENSQWIYNPLSRFMSLVGCFINLTNPSITLTSRIVSSNTITECLLNWFHFYGLEKFHFDCFPPQILWLFLDYFENSDLGKNFLYRKDLSQSVDVSIYQSSNVIINYPPVETNSHTTLPSFQKYQSVQFCFRLWSNLNSQGSIFDSERGLGAYQYLTPVAQSPNGTFTLSRMAYAQARMKQARMKMMVNKKKTTIAQTIPMELFENLMIDVEQNKKPPLIYDLEAISSKDNQILYQLAQYFFAYFLEHHDENRTPQQQEEDFEQRVESNKKIQAYSYFSEAVTGISKYCIPQISDVEQDVYQEIVSFCLYSKFGVNPFIKQKSHTIFNTTTPFTLYSHLPHESEQQQVKYRYNLFQINKIYAEKRMALVVGRGAFDAFDTSPLKQFFQQIQTWNHKVENQFHPQAKQLLDEIENQNVSFCTPPLVLTGYAIDDSLYQSHVSYLAHLPASVDGFVDTNKVDVQYRKSNAKSILWPSFHHSTSQYLFIDEWIKFAAKDNTTKNQSWTVRSLLNPLLWWVEEVLAHQATPIYLTATWETNQPYYNRMLPFSLLKIPRFLQNIPFHLLSAAQGTDSLHSCPSHLQGRTKIPQVAGQIAPGDSFQKFGSLNQGKSLLSTILSIEKKIEKTTKKRFSPFGPTSSVGGILYAFGLNKSLHLTKMDLVSLLNVQHTFVTCGLFMGLGFQYQKRILSSHASLTTKINQKKTDQNTQLLEKCITTLQLHNKAHCPSNSFWHPVPFLIQSIVLLSLGLIYQDTNDSDLMKKLLLDIIRRPLDKNQIQMRFCYSFCAAFAFGMVCNRLDLNSTYLFRLVAMNDIGIDQEPRFSQNSKKHSGSNQLLTQIDKELIESHAISGIDSSDFGQGTLGVLTQNSSKLYDPNNVKNYRQSHRVLFEDDSIPFPWSAPSSSLALGLALFRHPQHKQLSQRLFPISLRIDHKTTLFRIIGRYLISFDDLKMTFGLEDVPFYKLLCYPTNIDQLVHFQYHRLALLTGYTLMLCIRYCGSENQQVITFCLKALNFVIDTLVLSTKHPNPCQLDTMNVNLSDPDALETIQDTLKQSGKLRGIGILSEPLPWAHPGQIDRSFTVECLSTLCVSFSFLVAGSEAQSKRFSNNFLRLLRGHLFHFGDSSSTVLHTLDIVDYPLVTSLGITIGLLSLGNGKGKLICRSKQHVIFLLATAFPLWPRDTMDNSSIPQLMRHWYRKTVVKRKNIEKITKQGDLLLDLETSDSFFQLAAAAAVPAQAPATDTQSSKANPTLPPQLLNSFTQNNPYRKKLYKKIFQMACTLEKKIQTSQNSNHLYTQHQIIQSLNLFASFGSFNSSPFIQSLKAFLEKYQDNTMTVVDSLVDQYCQNKIDMFPPLS